MFMNRANTIGSTLTFIEQSGVNNIIFGLIPKKKKRTCISLTFSFQTLFLIPTFFVFKFIFFYFIRYFSRVVAM